MGLRRTLHSCPLITVLLVCAMALPAAAQNGRITGAVTDSTAAQPVSGVQIIVVGTGFGATSADNGRYVIPNVPPGRYRLEARRIGYAPIAQDNVVVASGTPTTVDFRVAPVALRLQEQVITGVTDPTSGTKTPFTVGRVTAEDIPVPPTNAMEAIQGRVAGASVVAEGQPGAGTNILLRTPTSINKANTPLIVVDGVILAQTIAGSTADLDALDIESIEVVKGAAAASLYGSRAASGVIQIRTKRGAALPDGRTRIIARSEVGVNELANPIGWARYNAYQLGANGQYINAAGRDTTAVGRVARPLAERFQDQPYPGQTSNQVDALFDPGETYINSLSIAQNLGNTNFLASLANHRTEGVLRGDNGYSRNDVRLNLDHRPRSDLSVAFSGYFSRSKRDDIYGDAFFDLIHQGPDVNLLTPDPDGTPFVFQADPDPSTAIRPNPLYILATQDEATRRTRALGSMEVRYAPLSWLTFDANASYDRSDRLTEFFLDRGLRELSSPSGGVGRVQRINGQTSALNAALSANLLGRWRDLTLRSTLRGLMEREENEQFGATGTDLAVPGVPNLSAARTVSPVSFANPIQEIRANGYFATLGADYAGKYIADGLIRRDGSSLFGPEERWHTYYRTSLAYRMAEEAWWPWKERINEFKLRASRGTAGGRPSFADQYETYDLETGGTLRKSTLGNRVLKPERATETEVGLDAIAFNRVSLQLSYARSTVEDQLILIPLPAAFGYSSQWQNAGTVKGSTVEATLEAQVLNTRKTSWKVGVVADRARHKVTEFNRSCFQTETVGYRCAGEPLGAMYGFKFTTGVDELAPVVPEAQRGQFQVNDDGLVVWVGDGGSWRDAKWGTTTTINKIQYSWGLPIQLRDSVRVPQVVRIGSSNPDFHFGVTNNVRWRGFSVYGLLDVAVGGQIYNRTKQRMYQYYRSADEDQAGKPQAEKKTQPYYFALYNVNNVNNWFVEDGGFIKLRELSAKYRIPGAFLSRIGAQRVVQGISLGVIGRNLWTKSNYSGYDPEVGRTILRLDDFIYPQFRTITGTVEIEF
ncbi:MAG: SusC/RagA family TonB-linked outer membrane protein [Gemmatimonadaceae bacterium]